MEKIALRPDYKITYQGKDVTAELAPYVSDVTYTDRLTGQSDELEISLDNPDGRWFKSWYPPKGAEIKYEYGYAHKPLLSAGAFCVDEVELSGPPDVVKIKALATGLKRQARTRIGKSYENTSLQALADTVAKRLKAKIHGTIPSVKIPKVTQFGETDWAFLVRVFREYGYEIKLTDNNQKLVVAKLKDGGGIVRTIKKSDIKTYRYADKISEVPVKTETKGHNSRKKKQTKGQSSASTSDTASDVRHKTVPAKSDSQAKAMAEAEQERHEVDKTSLEITLEGDITLVAGATVDVTEWGAMNGEYMITESKQSINSNGLETAIQMKRIKEK